MAAASNNDFNWGEEGTGQNEKMIYVFSWLAVFIIIALAGLYLRRETDVSIETAKEAVEPKTTEFYREKGGEWTALVGRFVSLDKATEFAAECHGRGHRAVILSEGSGFDVQVDRFETEESARQLVQTLIQTAYPAKIARYRDEGILYTKPEVITPVKTDIATIAGTEPVTVARREGIEPSTSDQHTAGDKRQEDARGPDITPEAGIVESGPKKAEEKQIEEMPELSSDKLDEDAPAVPDSGITRLLRSITRESRTGSWTIQTGFFSQEKNALNLRETIQKHGFSAFVISTAGGYQVQAGDYNSREETALELERLIEVPELKALEPYIVQVE